MTISFIKSWYMYHCLLVTTHQCKTASPQKPVKYVSAIAKINWSLFALYWLVLDCLITLYTGLLVYNYACVDLEEVEGGGGGFKNGPGPGLLPFPTTLWPPLGKIFNPVFYRYMYIYIMLFLVIKNQTDMN